MATNTYVALQTTTVSTAATSVTLSSIPQGYTDLVIVINANLASTASTYMNFNGDTAGNYSLTRIYGNGSTAVSDRIGTNLTGIDVSYTGSGVGNNVIINVMNYSNATTYKTSLNRWNTAGSTGYVGANVSLWRNTAAITSIVFSNSVNFAVGSTFTIYGIAAASVGAKATGGTIYQDASYFYHVFSGNGTFTPSQSISADVLVVAGGGGGGCDIGGGGGAGGYLTHTSQSLTAIGYTVTVGAGGAGGASAGLRGANGGNSSFAALTASVGGGGGGGYNSGSDGFSGGSGSGAAYNGSSGGSATSGQGYAGGAGNASGGAGGGGGAGAVGGTAIDATQMGNGGNGSSTYSSWGVATGTGENVSGTYYYAGGGAGGGYGTNASFGLGGYGGGGAAGKYNGTPVKGTNAAVNTGGGGGGGSAYGGTGGTGASGLVIVRYAK